MMKRKSLLQWAAALLIALSITIPQTYAAPAASDTRIDAVLSVDVSNSMNESDVNKVSYEAMKMFIDMASVQGDRIGVVAYTDQVMREKALLKIGGAKDKDELKKFIDQLALGPYTDLAVGVDEAVKVLDSGAEPGHVPLIVLLTDGNNSLRAGQTQEKSQEILNQAVQKAKGKGIPIYTIGLNADGQLNKDELDRISKETGGKMFVTSTADKLPEILSEIYASHLKLKVVPLPGLTANGDFQNVVVNIPTASVAEANISIMSPNPVEVKLSDPAGKEQPIPSDRIVYSKSKAYSLIKILNPAQGDWNLKIKGVSKDKIDINLIYNYELKVSMVPLSSISYSPGDSVPVKAYLMSNGQKVNDPGLYKNAKASLVLTDLDTKKTTESPLTSNPDGIEGSIKVPEAHDYELKVKVEDANFLRESEPVAISAKKPASQSAPAETSQENEGRWLKLSAWGGALLVVIAAALAALAYWKKANRGFVGQLVVEIRDEDTGERTSPQYKKLHIFKGKFNLHQLLQLAPDYAETADIVFRPGRGDTLNVVNKSGCVMEKGGRAFEAEGGKEIFARDCIKITLKNVNKVITLEYLK
ncbi:hypothetical protein PAECIP111802_03202 [Paenibacillus allorhizosphaerae]|uniref:VWFA domain-containing protein n=2 Tax=Paenibacillus allorhizosphaerae TaxID=2849866 RepID=A0ABM8VIR3_9BACL|nr:hypothetical protein PAECIP111802_03202 [Paenibacillus allorhizosphaerae]